MDMTTGRSSALPRSLPVLFLLVLALFSPAPRALPATSGPVTASCASAERVARTAEEAAPAALEPGAAPSAVSTPAADRAPALTPQDTARAAVSRAPPPAV
ncbi:hypothetical protein [Actinoplanes philippinensis]|uniref:hypothetical protein n=1 Tax=Actinoplanes philippinensis TaxID=35752 RepID=UPI0033FD8FCF